MDKKTIIVVVVAVAIVIVAAGLYGMSKSNETQSVTYNGNGGIYEGETTFISSEQTVLPIMFINSGQSFSEWNTKADGSGETYAVGEDVSHSIVLYAQWVHAVTSYSSSIVGDFTPQLYMDGEVFGIGTYLGSTSTVTLSGGSGWVFDSISDSFRCMYEGNEYIVELGFAGAQNINYAVIGGVPTITMDTPVNIGLSLSVHPLF